MTTETTNAKIHPFEQAGLGIAPFRFVGAFEKRGPIKTTNPDYPGVTFETGAPGQPMGVCEFCYQGIAVCCQVEDRDGKRFVVGQDCIRQVFATGTRVRTDVDRAIKAAKNEKDEARIAAVRERLATDEALRAALNLLPSPNFARRDTALMWADWMIKNAGLRGRMEVVRYIARMGV